VEGREERSDGHGKRSEGVNPESLVLKGGPRFRFASPAAFSKEDEECRETEEWRANRTSKND